MKIIRAVIFLVSLFALSVAVRRPLFNNGLSRTLDYLSAHALLVTELWAETPASVHHFNLLGTFSRPEDKFIDNLGTSGVADRAGNFYYISMPHLEFLMPWAFFTLTGQSPSVTGIQIFALLMHALVCGLIFLLVRVLTGSMEASLAAVCVLLFAPEALLYYQNGVVGSMLVLPYTIGLLYAVTALTKPEKPRAIWGLLFASVLLGCLTDWHGCFTGFSTVVVMLFLAATKRVPVGTALRIAGVCCLAVGVAVALILWQDSKIAGLGPFVRTLLGRLRERTGSKGLGLNSLGYYQNLAKFYAGYAPFLLAAGVLMWLTIREGGRELLSRGFRLARIPLSIAVLAVVLDHAALANHTAEHSFTTLNDLVPIAILAGVAVAAYLAGGVKHVRRGLLVFGLFGGCVVTGIAIYYGYYVVYSNRPQPYSALASSVASAAEPRDVIFAAGQGFRLPRKMIVQVLYHVRRNIVLVNDADEAAKYLACRHFSRGTLAWVRDDWAPLRTEAVFPSPEGCGTASIARALP